jgi:hypothetical protein
MFKMIFAAAFGLVVAYVAIRELGSPAQAEAAKHAAEQIGGWIVDVTVGALVDLADKLTD